MPIQQGTPEVARAMLERLAAGLWSFLAVLGLDLAYAEVGRVATTVTTDEHYLGDPCALEVPSEDRKRACPNSLALPTQSNVKCEIM